MRAGTRALAADEIAIGGGRAAFFRRHLVRVHRQAHRTARFTPLEPRLDEDPVKPFLFGLKLDQARTRDDERLPDIARDLAPPGDRCRRAQILDPAVGAGAADWKSVVWGKSVAGCVTTGGRRY